METTSKVTTGYNCDEKYFKDPSSFPYKPHSTPLHIAVEEKRDSDLILKILRHYRRWIDQYDTNGNLPLHLAVNPRIPGSNCNLRVVKLLSTYWTLRQRNNIGRTVLHEAVYHNADVKVLRFVLKTLQKKRKTVINMSDYQNCDTALHLAARPDYDPIKVKALVEFGVDRRLKNKIGRTPLIEALVIGCPNKIIQHLLSGQSVNIVDNQHRSPLRLAMEFCDISTIRILLKAGADVSSFALDGMTPLHEAAMQKDIHPIFLQLSNEGRLPDLRDKNLNTPLLLALLHGADVSVLQAFMWANSDLLLCNTFGETALHCAVKGECSLEVIDMLLDYRPEWIHQEDYRGNIPLHFAWNQVDKIRRLVTAGSNPWWRNMSDKTPLRFALKKNCDHLVVKEYLLHMHLNALLIKKTYLSEYYLHTAVRHARRPFVIQTLLQAGFSVRSRDLYENIPLHCVVNTSFSLKELLRGHPETICERNNAGVIPLKVADKKGYSHANMMLYWTALQDQKLAKRAFDLCKHSLQHEKLISSYLKKCLKHIQMLQITIVTDKISLYDLVREEYQTMTSLNSPWTVKQELRYRSADRALNYCDRKNMYWKEIRVVQKAIAASKIFDLNIYTDNTRCGKRVILVEAASRSVYQYLSLADKLNVSLAYFPGLENRMSAGETSKEVITSAVSSV